MMTAAATRRFIERWVFHVRGPESPPVVLRQRRVFVLPTGAGAAFATTILFLLVGSINYMVSLGYLLTFLLSGLGITAILHTFRNLAHLRVAPGRCSAGFVGATISYGVVLTNARHDARPAVSLRLRSGEATLLDVPAAGSVAATIGARASRRGWQEAGRIMVETTYPLGLIRAWSYVDLDLRCLVYPRPERDPPPLPAPEGGKDSHGRPSGGADDFAGLRTHQPTDSPRHIAWKSCARGGPLLTKQFVGGGAGTLWLDWDRLPIEMDVESRLSRLAAHVLLASQTHTAFGLRLPGRVVPPGTGEEHRAACLEALALYDGKER